MAQEFDSQTAIDGHIGVETKTEGHRPAFGADAESCDR
jgi:hypothetical protein